MQSNKNNKKCLGGRLLHNRGWRSNCTRDLTLRCTIAIQSRKDALFGLWRFFKSILRRIDYWSHHAFAICSSDSNNGFFFLLLHCFLSVLCEAGPSPCQGDGELFPVSVRASGSTFRSTIRAHGVENSPVHPRRCSRERGQGYFDWTVHEFHQVRLLLIPIN